MFPHWILKPQPDAKDIKSIKESIGVSDSLAKILAQRNIIDYEELRNFFSPQLSHLHDPFFMKDMDKATERILRAIENQENIMVYGDYDVDGTTSVAMMYTFLKTLANNITYYIPDRYKEGYGISKQGIDYADDNNITLIITLDCGIKDNEMIKYAKGKEIDFIICDHHLPGKSLPDAVAVLDPKREDCSYPYKGLSGCGVGFKLMQALAKKINIPQEKLHTYLDLVAVSIAADIVPITGENRILAHFGLKQLNEKPRLGLELLIPKESKGQISISKIVFNIAPKINAAGRMKEATDAVRLLITENKTTGRKYLSQINGLNKERKEIDSTITHQALEQLKEQNKDKFTTIVYDPNWHKGVIGIVASRLVEKYYRPTVVFTKGENDRLVASVRSVKGFDVYEALLECSDLLERFGGHMYAAGLTMKEVDFLNFKRRFEKVVAHRIHKAQQIPTLEIDTEISFKEITPKFFRILKRMEPFGPENLTPNFLTKGVRADKIRKIGKKGEHLRFDIFHTEVRKVFPAVAFQLGNFANEIEGKTFDIVHVIEENVWQGKSHIQLRVKDLRIHQE